MPIVLPQYLEIRFGRLTRITTSLAFSVQMIFYIAIVLYVPALTLEAVTGLPRSISIIAVGLVCVFYSTMGGIKAVIVTDLFQVGARHIRRSCIGFALTAVRSSRISRHTPGPGWPSPVVRRFAGIFFYNLPNTNRTRQHCSVASMARKYRLPIPFGTGYCRSKICIIRNFTGRPREKLLGVCRDSELYPVAKQTTVNDPLAVNVLTCFRLT